MLYNDGAVILGLVYGFLPFMVLPFTRRSNGWTRACAKPRPIWARSRSRRCCA